MPEDKRKLCVWVPEKLYNNVVKAGYDGPTSAVTQGFDLLLKFNKWQTFKLGTNDNSSEKDPKDKIEYKEYNGFKDNSTFIFSNFLTDQYNNIQVTPTDLLAENAELKNEVERLNEAMQKAPDPVEIAELRASVIGLQKLLEEKDKRIEDLIKAVEMLNVFANYFKNVNQNK